MTNVSHGIAELLIISPTVEHTSTVIFCHGLGQLSSFYEPHIRSIALRHASTKWICPQAPNCPVTYSNGRLRPSWFDIHHLPPHTDELDEIEVSTSIKAIEQLILSEVHIGIDPKRILLAGFSQGAALCLMTALTTLHDIGGVGSLSGWIPHRIREHIIQNDPNIPIFWAHGRRDTEIPLQYARNSVEFLEQRLCMNDETLRYLDYDNLGHEVSEEVFRDFSQWLSDILSKNQ